MSGRKLEKKLFGTNGVRGVVGKDMNPELVLSIGLALGSMRGGRIAIGRDTRTSGQSLASAAKAGLMAAGCTVMDLGVLPTPALQYLVRSYCDGGIMVTASHNPPEYNGVKIIEADGTEMGDEETIKLEDVLFSRRFPEIGWDGVGFSEDHPALTDEYIRGIAGNFPEGIGSGITVVVDPGSGAASFTTPAILTRMGCRVLTINAVMDGRFPGRLPEPTPSGLAPLCELVRSSGAAFGVAHDGDADRAVFVDETGQFIEEDREFAFIADYLCRQRNGVVVAPVSTSMVVEETAERNGSRVVYTPVGSIYVARTMRALIDQGEPVVFGGEGNGGLIFPGHQFCRDGGMTAAMMVSICASEQKPLSELIGRLPASSMFKDKIRIEDPALMISTLERELAYDRIDRTDGIRISRGRTWALIRPSGTEPLVRIFVESPDTESTMKFYAEIMGAIKRLST